MTDFPPVPKQMPEVKFDGEFLHEKINGLYILDFDEPKNKPREENKVRIPGRDYDYDFGNTYKQNFNITIDIVVITGNDDLEEKLDSLGEIIDVVESKELIINGNTYYGQAFEPMSVNKANGGGYALVEIVLECREPTDQDE